MINLPNYQYRLNNAFFFIKKERYKIESGLNHLLRTLPLFFMRLDRRYFKKTGISEVRHGISDFLGFWLQMSNSPKYRYFVII